MASPPLPSHLIPSMSPPVRSIRAFASGMQRLVISLSVSRVQMATRTLYTQLLLHQTARISSPALSTRRSRCGSSSPLAADTPTMPLKAAAASRHSKATRTSFCPSLLRLMETGFSQDPKIEACSSGTRERAIRSLCCRGIRTLSSQWHRVHLVAALRQDLGI
jgi:hypothetical protein